VPKVKNLINKRKLKPILKYMNRKKIPKYVKIILQRRMQQNHQRSAEELVRTKNFERLY